MDSTQKFHRGDIWMVDVPKPNEPTSIQYGKHPYVILWSNDFLIGNPSSIACASITTKNKRHLPVHVPLPRGIGNIKSDSTILIETLDTIPSKYFLWKIGQIPDGHEIFSSIQKAIMIQFEINPENLR